jgi:uncharacterized protein (DUF486 family)
MPSAAYAELSKLLSFYTRVLPSWSFPYVPLTIAAVFQVIAWFGGQSFYGLSLIPRVLVLWLFAFGEYGFMSPAMNAAQEILGTSEATLVIVYQMITLIVFLLVNKFWFKKTLSKNNYVSFAFASAAIYFAVRGPLGA